MATFSRPLAVVTGDSTGIGLELARQCVEHGFDLIIAADEARIQQAAAELQHDGAAVQAVQADLSNTAWPRLLAHAIGTRNVEALLSNAGRGRGAPSSTRIR